VKNQTESLIAKLCFKMAIYQGLNDILSSIKSALEHEEKVFQRNITSAVGTVKSDVIDEFKTVVDFVETQLREAGELVEADVLKVEQLLDKIKNEIEAKATSEYESFVGHIEKAITHIKTVSSTAVGDMGTASSYLRNHAVIDFDLLISNTKAKFKKAEGDFRAVISDITDKAGTSVKAGVSSLVSGAQSDLDKIKAHRTKIDDDVEAKFEEVKKLFEDIKDDARSELDKIVQKIETALDGMEGKVKKFTKDINSAVIGISIAAITVSIVAGGLLVIYSSANSKKPPSDDE